MVRGQAAVQKYHRFESDSCKILWSASEQEGTNIKMEHHKHWTDPRGAERVDHDRKVIHGKRLQLCLFANEAGWEHCKENCTSTKPWDKLETTLESFAELHEWKGTNFLAENTPPVVGKPWKRFKAYQSSKKNIA